MGHLLKYDSVLGQLGEDVEVGDGVIKAGKSELKVLSERDPAALPWGDLEVDLVIESTGFFTDRDGAQKHLDAGAKKVVISAPATDPDVTIVLGVNDDTYDPEQHHIISNASCTTNCVAPLAKVLHDNFTVEQGFMTTIHAYTNDQQILDLPHKDLRRARAAAINLIPTSTGAARAIGLVLPDLKGKVDGISVRAPVPTGSITDLVVRLGRDVTVDEVNSAYRAAAEAGPLEGTPSLRGRPARLDRHRALAVLLHRRQRSDDGERDDGQGVRLVRQRVGLQLPARRRRGEDRGRHPGDSLRVGAPAAVGTRCRHRRQASARPLRPERPARGRPDRGRHANPGVAADAAAAPRARCERGRRSARISGGPREKTRRSRSARWQTACASSCPTTVFTCSRTRASTRARRRTTPGSRESSPTATTSSSRTRSDPCIARTPRRSASRNCFPPTRASCSNAS